MAKEIKPEDALNNIYKLCREIKLSASEHEQVKEWGEVVHKALTKSILKTPTSNGKAKKKEEMLSDEEIEEWRDKKR